MSNLVPTVIYGLIGGAASAVGSHVTDTYIIPAAGNAAQRVAEVFRQQQESSERQRLREVPLRDYGRLREDPPRNYDGPKFMIVGGLVMALAPVATPVAALGILILCTGAAIDMVPLFSHLARGC